jgi:fibronectin type 3 domain-containing protein
VGITQSPNLYCSKDAFDKIYHYRLDGFVLKIIPTPGVPPAPPVNFIAIPSDFEIFLSWERPDDEGGCRLQGYELYRLGSDMTWKLLMNDTVYLYHDSNVENGKTYQYRVRAYSNAGMGGFATLQSTVLVRPSSPPLNLTLSTGNGTVSLAWEPPLDLGGGVLEGYTVYRGPTRDSMSPLEDIGDATEYMDDTVVLGESYFYKVAARNAAGIGEFTQAVLVKALGLPGMPGSFDIVAGDHQCTLSWQPPAVDGGSMLLGYRVYRGLAPDAMLLLASKANDQIEHQDASLANGRPYFYCVAAFTEVGEGPPTITAEATPFGLPGRPVGLEVAAGSGQNELIWDPPADDGGSQVLGYVILWSEVDGPVGTPFRIGNVTSFAHTGLENGVTYEYQVRAVNKAGDGSVSEAARGTPLGAPGAVRDLTVENDESGVVLRWTPPIDWGGAVELAYVVLRGSSEDVVEPLANVTDATEYTDAAVETGTTYYYRVQASNLLGSGPPSSARSVVRTTPPGPVAGFAARPGDGRVVLEWSPPASDGGSAVLEYVVLRGQFPMGLAVLHRTPSGTNYTDASVENGKSYYYCVYAVNDVGDGARSDVLEVVPLAPPGPPTGFRVEPGKDGIALSWGEPIGGARAPVTGYRVLRGESRADLVLLADVGMALNYTDTTVEKGRTYYYSVVAVSDVGQGEPTSVLEGKVKKAEDGPGPGSGAAIAAMVAVAGMLLTWSQRKMKH